MQQFYLISLQCCSHSTKWFRLTTVGFCALSFAFNILSIIRNISISRAVIRAWVSWVLSVNATSVLFQLPKLLCIFIVLATGRGKIISFALRPPKYLILCTELKALERFWPHRFREGSIGQWKKTPKSTSRRLIKNGKNLWKISSLDDRSTHNNRLAPHL